MRVLSRGYMLRHLRRELFILCHLIIVAMVAAFTERSGVTPIADMPIFLPRPANFSFHSGDTAVLPCAVQNVGTKTVIWRRASDPNPLTIGELVFVSDDRYSVHRVPARHEWNLHVRDLRQTDEGVYECQVSSKYKIIRHMLLRVNMTERLQREEYDSFKKVPVSGAAIQTPVHDTPAITMNGTNFVEKGDPIHLKCNASGVNSTPDTLDWFKNGLKVTADVSQYVTIEQTRMESSHTLVSVLHKRYSDMDDAGTYVCRSSDLGFTSFKVNVLNAGSTNVRRGAVGGNFTDDSGHGAQLSPTSFSLFVGVFCYIVTQVH